MQAESQSTSAPVSRLEHGSRRYSARSCSRRASRLIWANTWKRDDNGYFSAHAHHYQTHTARLRPRASRSGATFPPGSQARSGSTSPATSRCSSASRRRPPWTPTSPASRHTDATKLNLDPFKVTYVDHTGTVDPGRPAREPFWAAAVSGTSSPAGVEAPLRHLVDRRDERRRLSRRRGDDRRRCQGPGAALGRNRAEPVRSRAARRRRADVRWPLAELGKSSGPSVDRFGFFDHRIADVIERLLGREPAPDREGVDGEAEDRDGEDVPAEREHVAGPWRPISGIELGVLVSNEPR